MGRALELLTRLGDQLILHITPYNNQVKVLCHSHTQLPNRELSLFLLLAFFSLTDSVTFALSVDWQISQLLSWTVTNLVHTLFSLRCQTCKSCGWTETISPIFLFSLRKLPPVSQTWGTSLCWTTLRLQTTSMEDQNRSMKTTGIICPCSPRLLCHVSRSL